VFLDVVVARLSLVWVLVTRNGVGLGRVLVGVFRVCARFMGTVESEALLM